MDKLVIKDLVVFANHGVFEAEKQLGQKFVLTITVEYDMTKAAKVNDLTASIHYGELSEKITAWMMETTEDLIETVAYRLIENIFKEYPVSQSVTVQLKKPWAPVHLPLEHCSITLTRTKKRAFIGLGTNQGNKLKQLDLAKEAIKNEGITIVKTSSVIETEPWGNVEQDTFLNQVIEVETYLTSEELLQILLTIELDMGRVRELRWGPRIIDLDILFIGNDIIYTDNLIVPHPYVHEREFVLTSLNEIAPHFIHPVYRQSIRQLFHDMQNNM